MEPPAGAPRGSPELARVAVTAAAAPATPASSSSSERSPEAPARTPPFDAVRLLIGPYEVEFALSRVHLLRYPDSMLGRMFAESNRPLWEGKGPYRFPEADADVFAAVAAFYATGELAPPSHHSHVYRELDFWRVEPQVKPLLAEPSVRGVSLADHLDALVTFVMDELHDDLLEVAVTGGSCTVFVVRPILTALREVTAVVRAAKSRTLFDGHSPDTCDDCYVAGRVTHFWPVVSAQVHLREMLEVDIGKLRAAQPDGAVAAQTALAADHLYDSIVAKLLLAGNALFLHRLRVALALMDVEAAFDYVETGGFVPEEHLRLGGLVHNGLAAVWLATPKPAQLAGLDPPPANQLRMYTQITLTAR
jgi:hypothetical protein